MSHIKPLATSTTEYNFPAMKKHIKNVAGLNKHVKQVPLTHRRTREVSFWWVTYCKIPNTLSCMQMSLCRSLGRHSYFKLNGKYLNQKNMFSFSLIKKGIYFFKVVIQNNITEWSYRVKSMANVTMQMKTHNLKINSILVCFKLS